MSLFSVGGANGDETKSSNKLPPKRMERNGKNEAARMFNSGRKMTFNLVRYSKKIGFKENSMT